MCSVGNIDDQTRRFSFFSVFVAFCYLTAAVLMHDVLRIVQQGAA